MGSSVTWWSDSRALCGFSIKHSPLSLACEQVRAKTVRWPRTQFCFDNHCLHYPWYLWWFSSDASLLCVHLPQRLSSRVAKRVSSEGKWTESEPCPTTLSLCDLGKLLNFLVTLSPHPWNDTVISTYLLAQWVLNEVIHVKHSKHSINSSSDSGDSMIPLCSVTVLEGFFSTTAWNARTFPSCQVPIPAAAAITLVWSIHCRSPPLLPQQRSP